MARKKPQPRPDLSNQPPIRCAFTRIAPVSELKPFPNNPNRHPPAQLAAYARILRHQGIRKALTVSKKSGFIVTGNGLFETALLEGWQFLPIDEQDFATAADEKAHVLADNQLPEMAELDPDLARDLLSDLGEADFDLDLTGFGDDDLAKLFGTAEPSEPVVRKINVRPLPKMAWVLIGVPVGDFGPVQALLDQLPEQAVISTMLSDGKRGRQD